MVEGYSAGTVWLQVAPSFLGVQDSIRKEMRGALHGVNAEIDRSSKDMEKRLGAVGEEGSKKLVNSFEKLTRPRFKQIAKDFEVLSRSLNGGEIDKFRKSLAALEKANLSKITDSVVGGQREFLDLSKTLRREVQQIIDEGDAGTRKLSKSARTMLGAIRQPLDEIEESINRWNAADPKRAARLESERRQYALIAQAQREMGADFAKRDKAEQDALNRKIAAWAKWQDDQLRGLEEQEKLQARLNAEAQRAGQLQATAQREDLQRQKAINDELQRAGQLQARAQRENIEIDVKVNKDRLDSELTAIRNQIRNLSTDLKVNPVVDVAATEREIQALRARLATLEADAVTVDIDVDTTAAMIQLRMLEAQLSKTAQGTTLMGRALRVLDAGSAANSVRVFNGALFTTLLLGPALIPVLGGVAAGILGVGAAAVSAVGLIGILVAAFSGIGGAVSAMNELDRAQRLEKQGAGSGASAAASQRDAIMDARRIADAQRGIARARESAAEAMVTANRRIEDAEKGLAAAQRDAADAAEDSARRVTDAERALLDAREAAADSARDHARAVTDAESRVVEAQQAALEAQNDLNAARQQAVRDLEDLNNALDDSRLKERDLAFSLEEARVHLNVVLEDDQATDREKAKAQLAVDQATEALEQQRLETGRLEVDTTKANKAGVEGSERVVEAKDRIAEADKSLSNAQRDLGRAQEARDEAAEDGARRVKDARLDLKDAIEAQSDQEVASAEAINEAELALRDARTERAQAARDGARAVADAERDLAEVHQDIALRADEAAVATGGLATATDNLNEALRGLSPAGVAFATWLYSLKPLLDDLRTAAQEGFLPGLQEGLTLVVDKYAEPFIDFVGVMAGVAGDLAKAFGEMLVSPEWAEMFSEIAEFAPTMLRQFGEISMNFLTAFMELFVAFLPFMVEMGDWLLEMSESFKDWASGLKDSEGFETFLQYLRETLPLVSELIGNIGQVLVNLFIGLAPYAEDLLKNLIDFTEWLAEMDPDDLARLALSIGGLTLAIQALAGAMALVSGVGGLFGGLLRMFGAGGKKRGVAGAPIVVGAGDKEGKAGKARGGKGGLLAGILGTIGLAGLGGGGDDSKDAGSGIISWLGGDKLGRWFSDLGGKMGGAATKGGLLKGALKLLGKGALAALGPVGLVIGVVWLLYDAFTYAYENIEGFRTFVDEALADVRSFFEEMWQGEDGEGGIQSVFQQIYETYLWFDENVIQPFEEVWEAMCGLIEDTFTAVWEDVLKPTFEFIGGAFEVLWEVIDTFATMFTEIFENIIAPALTAWWEDNVEPVLTDIGEAWDALAEGITDWWVKNVKPILEDFADFIEDKISPAVESGVERIGEAWNGLLNVFRTPIRWFIETVMNDGIINAYNTLASKFDMDEIDPISVPASLLKDGGKSKKPKGASAGGRPTFSTGGIYDVLPGYTPGRDVHTFYSPTAGYLDLSGGEGILRPELVAAIGAGRFNAANKAARSGDISGGLGYLGGFKDGGVLGGFGSWAGDVIDKAKGALGGLGDAVSNPTKWLRELVEGLVEKSGFSGAPADLIGGAGVNLAKGIGEWIKSAIGGGDGGYGGAKGGPAGSGKVMGVEAMTRALAGIDPSARVSSSYRPGAVTATGYRSFHSLGRAIDIVSPNMGKTWDLLRAAFGANSPELFYTPKGFMRYGKMGDAAPVTKRTHYSHVHWAMNQGGILPTLYDQGGDLPPGLSVVLNKTRKPESIVTDEMMEQVTSRGGDTNFVFKDNKFGYDPDEVAAAITKRRSDELALAGIDEGGDVW